jgi:hypothetical protein
MLLHFPHCLVDKEQDIFREPKAMQRRLRKEGNQAAIIEVFVNWQITQDEDSS